MKKQPNDAAVGKVGSWARAESTEHSRWYRDVRNVEMADLVGVT